MCEHCTYANSFAIRSRKMKRERKKSARTRAPTTIFTQCGYDVDDVNIDGDINIDRVSSTRESIIHWPSYRFCALCPYVGCVFFLLSCILTATLDRLMVQNLLQFYQCVSVLVRIFINLVIVAWNSPHVHYVVLQMMCTILYAMYNSVKIIICIQYPHYSPSKAFYTIVLPWHDIIYHSIGHLALARQIL